MGNVVYIPDELEMEKLDEILSYNNIYFNSNSLYYYCLTKKIELIIAHGGFSKFNNLDYEDLDIVKGIIKYIPTDIRYTNYNNRLEIVKLIIERNDKVNIDYGSGLFNLNLVDKNLYEDSQFFKFIVGILYASINQNNAYRFTYKNNLLLDNIFGRKIDSKLLSSFTSNDSVIQQLLEIEPSYILDFSDSTFGKKIDDKVLSRKASATTYAILRYAARFNVEVLNEDYDKYNKNEKDKKCKQLIKFLQENK